MSKLDNETRIRCLEGDLGVLRQRLDRALEVAEATKGAANPYRLSEALDTVEGELLSIARSIGQRRYWNYIRGMAECVVAEHKEDRSRDLSDLIHETVDGCSRVIYTAQALDSLFHSPNEGAMEEQLGETSPDASVRAYWAIRADVEAHIREDLEYDPDAEDEDEESDDA